MNEKLKPSVCVIKTDGTNCDQETMYAFELAGASSKLVHMNELIKGDTKLCDYQILAYSGGFSHGDDIASGKVLAVDIMSNLGDQMYEFKEQKKGLILGVCNGFQVLVRTGLLPFGKLGEMSATLTHNDVGHFRCDWTQLKVEKSANPMLAALPEIVTYQVAHGEGKCYTNERVLENIEGEGLVAFRYVDRLGNPTQEYDANPNGSLNAIAGLTDPSGRILGLMPHPERFVKVTQYPNWRREPNIEPQGLPLFKGMVDYARQS